jgi:endonuclease/exonuclease/phosphatase family metal-dependent hydrolase
MSPGSPETMPLRVAVVNANKRLGQKVGRDGIARWVGRHRPDVILLQEPWVAGNPQSFAPDGYVTLAGNERVQAWVSGGHPSATATLAGPCFLRVTLAGWALVSVYLDSGKPATRAGQLLALRDLVVATASAATLVAGDFNLAPCNEDGRHREKASTFNNSVDRTPFYDLLEAATLTDLGAVTAHEVVARPRWAAVATGPGR